MSKKNNYIKHTEQGKVVDLRKRFGGRYQIQNEPSYYAGNGNRSRKDDPWLQIIPCHRGEIFPHGGGDLVASTNCSGSIANQLRELSCCVVAQDGDDGVNVMFDLDDHHNCLVP